jgi:hypothetical protein
MPVLNIKKIGIANHLREVRSPQVPTHQKYALHSGIHENCTINGDVLLKQCKLCQSLTNVPALSGQAASWIWHQQLQWGMTAEKT